MIDRWVVALAMACQTTVSTPPLEGHDRWVDEVPHAVGLETPFLCLDATQTEMVPCGSARPADGHLSCDASGCHGDTAYVPEERRHLLGSDGPSCFACHDRLWSDRVSTVQIGPPDEPAHDVSEDGYLHAAGLKAPFLCWSEDGRSFVTCPTERPDDARLSCDASGCHGTFTFDDPSATRRVLGDQGPSCFTCHDREWSTIQVLSAARWFGSP